MAEDYEEVKLKICKSNKTAVSGKTNKSILPDLKNYPLDTELQNKAADIHDRMIYKVRRKKIRTKLLFYCCLCAYKELGRNVDTVALSKIFGLSSTEVAKCDTLFSPLQTGYYPPETNSTPLKYLPEYFSKINLSEDIKDSLLVQANNILEKNPDLLEKSPQTVASGLFKYFLVTNGIVLSDQKILKEITGRSLATIDTMYKAIEVLDNK